MILNDFNPLNDSKSRLRRKSNLFNAIAACDRIRVTPA